MIVGETQILAQVKAAYSLSKELGVLSPMFEKLFQLVFGFVKKIRTETELGSHIISVAYAAVNLATRIFEDVRTTRVLLIGAGDTIERVGYHLQEQGVKQIVIANRQLERARVLSLRLQAQAITLSEMPNWLYSANIVFSAVTSPFPILGKGLVERALKMGKRRPLFMVDLAVPRNIEPEVREVEDVYLYTIDDLETIVEKNKERRQTAAVSAEHVIEKELPHLLQALQTLQVGHVIAHYREKMEAIRDRTVQNALLSLKQGVSPEEVVTELGRVLTNKLIHKPCKTIRQASYSQRSDILDAAKQLSEISS
jgi:glutamyl-tRNA reductase